MTGKLYDKHKQPLLNACVHNLDWLQVEEACETLLKQEKPSYIVEVNVDVLIKLEKDPLLSRIIKEADLSLADGKPLLWIAKWFGKPIKAKLSGSDLINILLKIADRNRYSVFILGGAAGVPEMAAENIKKRFHRIPSIYTHSPRFGFEDIHEELRSIEKRISEVRPDILVVCFGCPKQEKWIYRHYQSCGAKLSFCGGATVDFLAGRVKRAPKWVSESGFEWFYRFLQEPRRLFKRYFIDDMRIFYLLWKYRHERN